MQLVVDQRDELLEGRRHQCSMCEQDGQVGGRRLAGEFIEDRGDSERFPLRESKTDTDRRRTAQGLYVRCRLPYDQ